MMNYHTLVEEVRNRIAKEQDSAILKQLSDLVKRGLLVIESTMPVIVHAEDKGIYNLEVKQSVKLVLKDQEYIEKLEKENVELKDQIERIKQSLAV